MLKSEKKTYGTPLVEEIPLLPQVCYCGISGGDYHGSGKEGYDDDSD